MNPMRIGAVAAALAAGLTAGSHAAAADDMIGFGKETIQVNLGLYHPNFTTSVKESAPGSAVPPGSISGENDLGLDKSLSAARLDGYWRFADKHRLFFGYYNLNRDTSGVLNKDIGPVQIPSLGVNDTILAGSNITAKINWDVYIVGYGYSFYKTETTEIAAKLGLNMARMNANLNGTLKTLNNGVLNQTTAGNNSDVVAPLPVIAISGDWALSDRWRIKGSAGGFKAKVSGVDASVFDASLAAEYRLFRNFGIGGGYSLLKVSGDVSKSNYTGSLDWRTGGLVLYGSLVF